jgi:hypothetical protein
MTDPKRKTFGGRTTRRDGTFAGSDFDDEPTTIQRPPSSEEKTSQGGRPQRSIEINLVHEQGMSFSSADEDWAAIEVWTKHRIYQCNSSLVCIGVIERTSRRHDPSHALIGARLTGGQRRDGGGVLQLSHPLPLPGTEAVFTRQEKTRRFGQTSKVERVVMRVRLMTLTERDAGPIWDEMTTGGFGRS